MLDITFIKENREVVEKAIADKKGTPVDLKKLLKLYDERTILRGKVSEVNERRNKASKGRDIEAGKRLKEEGQNLEKQLRIIEREFVSLMIQVPNIPSPDTPVGPDESANKVLRTWGTPKGFSFKPKEHWELGAELDVIDNETAAEVSGARFTYLKGDIALMQFALIQHAFSVLTNKEKLESIAREAKVEVKATTFIPVVPPVMIKPEILNATGRLEPREDKYFLEKDNLFLVGTAEQSLVPMHMNKTFEEEDLPIRYVGYSTAFRREAGSYGKDTKGILRVHQFDKLEMETFVLPEHGLAEQNFIVAIQEHLMQSLNLPYQVTAICTGDMGIPDTRQFDIETWLPGQHAYRETQTSDYIGGFQARRLNTRVKRKSGNIEHVHMNDGTAFAIGRTLIAIMENYQIEDGSIEIPDVLQPYIGKKKIERTK